MNPDHEPGTTIRTGARSAPPDVMIRQSDPSLDSPFDLACSHRAQSTFLPIDRRQAMDVDEVTSHPIQLTEDTEREAKRACSRRIVMVKRGPMPKSWHVPHWLKSDVVTKVNHRMDKEDLELVEHARLLGQLFRDPAQRAKLAIGKKKDDKGFFEKTGEDQSGLQHVEESPSLPEQALNCSKNSEKEYCMSDEFIEKLDKKAKLYFSKMKQHSEDEIIENGRQFMKDEAFAAYRYYIAEHDLFEHCFTIEEFAKVYHHYNFTIETKAKDEDDWTSRLFFAEVKLLHGVKYYLCSPLELTDHGPCYSCEKRHATELQHPSGGGYAGYRDPASSYLSAERSSDNECA